MTDTATSSVSAFASLHDHRVARWCASIGRLDVYKELADRSPHTYKFITTRGAYAQPFLIRGDSNIALVVNKAKSAIIDVIDCVTWKSIGKWTIRDCVYAIAPYGDDGAIVITTGSRVFECRREGFEVLRRPFPYPTSIFPGKGAGDALICVIESKASLSIVDVRTEQSLLTGLPTEHIFHLQQIGDRVFADYELSNAEESLGRSSVKAHRVGDAHPLWTTECTEPDEEIYSFAACERADRLLVCIRSRKEKKARLQWSVLSTGRFVGTRQIEFFQIAWDVSTGGGALVGDFGWWNVETLEWTSFAVPLVSE